MFNLDFANHIKGNVSTGCLVTLPRFLFVEKVAEHNTSSQANVFVCFTCFIIDLPITTDFYSVVSNGQRHQLGVIWQDIAAAMPWFQGKNI